MSDDLVKRLMMRLQEIYDRPHDFSNGQKSEAAGLARDRIEELEAKLEKAVSQLDKLAYWLDIDQELWDAFTIMEKSDHRHMQSEVQTIKDILTGGKNE